jgi:hypothetical protein
MKKILFLMMAMFACWQVNAADYSQKNYIQQWGRLKIKGLQLSSESGEAVQLKGWSTHGLQWNEGNGCMNQNGLNIMKQWGANVVRLAMYVQEGGFATNPDYYLSQVKGYIDMAEKEGLYCVVDWHVLSEKNPQNTLNNRLNNKGAEYFFDQISLHVKQKGYKHVIYEICNEPNNCSWSDIKSYAETVLPHIYTNDPNALTIVGTPQWDQLPDQAANNPVSGYDGKLLYSFHFYSCTHSQFLSNLNTASGRVPMFVSEWGVVNFDGGVNSAAGKNHAYENDICPTQGNQLMAYCDGDNLGRQKISWCFWSWSYKDEAASSLKNCNFTSSNFSTETAAPSGKYILGKLCGDGDCKTVVTTDGPKLVQRLPSLGADGSKADGNDMFRLSEFDLGGESIAYHEGNSSGDSTVCLTEGSKSDNPNGCATINVNKCYAGADWCNYRNDECVDLTSIGGSTTGEYVTTQPYEIPSWVEYNIGWREPGEWMKYTIQVDEPAYYTFNYLNNGAGDKVTFTLAKEDGTGLGNCLYDSNTGKEVEAFWMSGEAGQTVNGVACYTWAPPCNGKSNPKPDYSVLIREAGRYTLKITWATDAETGIKGGNVGPFFFTKAKDYTGITYDEFLTDYKDASMTDANITIYPNPANEVLNINIHAKKIEVLNLVGSVIKVGEGNSINVADLANGTYLIRINETIVKQFIKN